MFFLPTNSPADRVIISNPKGSASNTSLSFEPHSVVLVIGINNSVTWVNDDSSPHTSHSDTSEFDSNIISPGGEFTHVFAKPGVYQYHCHLHPWMTGRVIVRE